MDLSSQKRAIDGEVADGQRRIFLGRELRGQIHRGFMKASRAALFGQAYDIGSIVVAHGMGVFRCCWLWEIDGSR